MASSQFEQQSRRHRIEDFWLVRHGTENQKGKRAIGCLAEAYAPEVLANLGFTSILPLNETMQLFRSGLGKFRHTFPFDFYAEQNGSKWLIDVTTYVAKNLPMSPLWDKLGVRLGVLFIRRDKSRHCFKEATGVGQVYLSLRDAGLERTSPSEAAYKAWVTRRCHLLTSP